MSPPGNSRKRCRPLHRVANKAQIIGDIRRNRWPRRSMESPYPVRLRIEHEESVARQQATVKYFSPQSKCRDGPSISFEK